MKKIKVLFCILTISQLRLYADNYANPELNLIFAALNAATFQGVVQADGEDSIALKFLNTMEKSIEYDQEQKNDLAATQSGYFSSATPLNPAKIKAQNKQLEASIKKLNANINAFEKNGVVAWEKQKVDARRSQRNAEQEQLNKNLAALQINQNGGVQAVQALIAKNELVFEQALESYIGSFGQCFVQNGSIVISSKYSKLMPITPKEYTQLVALLKVAQAQFGSNISINLSLKNAAPATIADIARYIGNMAPAGSSWLSYAKYAVGITAGVAAAIGAAAVVYNVGQGQQWNSPAAYNDGSSAASGAYNTYIAPQVSSVSGAYDNHIAPQIASAKETLNTYVGGAASYLPNNIFSSSSANNPAVQ